MAYSASAYDGTGSMPIHHRGMTTAQPITGGYAPCIISAAGTGVISGGYYYADNIGDANKPAWPAPPPPPPPTPTPVSVPKGPIECRDAMGRVLAKLDLEPE